ncbi:MAG: TIGR04002 family protein [Oscillospiraceae bacterium]
MNNKKKTRTIVLTALFAALIYLTTAYLFHIPTSNGGYIHVGDAFIYIAACVLPRPYAMCAASIGAGLSDLLSPGGAIFVIPTMLIKPLLVLPFTGKTKFLSRRNIVATVVAGVLGIAGYFVAEWIMFGNPMALLLTIPRGALQPIGSGILYVIAAIALDKAKVKERYIQKAVA